MNRSHCPTGRLALLTLLATVAGCGGPGHGNVSGHVLLDGKPLPGAILVFYSASLPSEHANAVLDQAGSYSVTLPVGEVLVGVDNRALQPQLPRGPAPLPPEMQAIRDKFAGRPAAPRPEPKATAKGPGRYVPIPKRYYSPESSELTFTVLPGETAHDIELSSK